MQPTSLFLLLVLLVSSPFAGCGESASVAEEPADRTFASSTVYVKFPDAPSSMDVEEALFRLELGAPIYAGERVVGIIEPKPGYDSSGKFSLSASYGSLADFISDMNSQDAKYVWESRTGSGYTLIFVYPANGAYIDNPVGSMSVSNKTVCEALESITDSLDPSRPGHGACVIRGGFRTVSNDEFASIREKKYSFATGSGADGRDAVEALLAKVGTPIGFRIGSPFGKGRVHWVLR